MHNFITKYLPILIIILISGCSFSKSNMVITEKKYETDMSVIELQIPEFKNFSDKDFEEKLNTDYTAAFNSWIKDFEEKCEKSTLEGEKCVLKITQDVKMASSSIFSLISEIYSFTDGMHASSFRVAKNIDVQRNREFQLSDLFSDGSYQNAINREISEILEENPEEYHDLWEKPILSSMHQEFFYLSQDGLVIFYPPYELSYYARGFVEFVIPYDELSGYFAPEYKFLANI